MNLNKIHLIGRVTKDPEVKALPSGVQVCSFSLATNRTWKDKDGAKQEETDFHNVVAFGKQAEVIGQYVKKGQLLFVEGRNKTRTWEHPTHKINMYRTEIIVENFQFGPKAGNTAAATSSDDSGIDFPEEEINPDDIPF